MPNDIENQDPPNKTNTTTTKLITGGKNNTASKTSNILIQSTIDRCLDILNKDETRKKIKEFVHPFVEIVLSDLYPYIYLVCIVVAVILFLNLSVFIFLMSKFVMVPRVQQYPQLIYQNNI